MVIEQGKPKAQTKETGAGRRTSGKQPARRTGRVQGTVALWHSTIGKKLVMAVTGLIMLAYLLLHMLGNLKIFFGPRDFDNYAHWLRTVGEPVLHGAWFLWISRAILLAAVVLHIVAAYQLSRRDLKARPVKYDHGQRPQATWAIRTMRYGGTILALFIVWHLLDLTAGVVNPDFREGQVYDNVTADFQVWWVNVIYIVAMVMLGLHINHGFWSASQTLGINSPGKDRAIKATGSTLAVVIAGGFILIPVAVMTGLVS